MPGSLFMMLTAGIEEADGKLTLMDAAAGTAATAGAGADAGVAAAAVASWPLGAPASTGPLTPQWAA